MDKHKVKDDIIYRHIETGGLYRIKGITWIESRNEYGTVCRCVKTNQTKISPSSEFDSHFELITNHEISRSKTNSN